MQRLTNEGQVHKVPISLTVYMPSPATERSCPVSAGDNSFTPSTTLKFSFRKKNLPQEDNIFH